MENKGLTVEYVRCDEGGENIALQRRLKRSLWKMQPKFEFTGRNTPQRNHLAEISFQVLANRGRAMLENVRVPKAYRYLLWREAFKTATTLDSLVQVEVIGVTCSRYQHWYGKMPAFVKSLICFFSFFTKIDLIPATSPSCEGHFHSRHITLQAHVLFISYTDIKLIYFFLVYTQSWLCVEHPIYLQTKGSWLQSQRN
jgi:hypothetical protein